MTSAWYILILLSLISFFIYYLIPIKIRWVFLLVVSLLFLYFVSGLFGFIYTLSVVFISYIGAYYIDKNNEDKFKAKILTLTVVILFLGLFVFKFTNISFYLTCFFSKAFNINENIVKNVIVPVGMSYYTLILVAYVVDVYRKVTVVESNFFKHILFSIYFPQLLMGPIVRNNDTKKQFFSEEQVPFSYIRFGVIRILWGILKKVVVADRIAIVVNTIFENYTVYPSSSIVLGVILFGLQLYIDFSAAMDIVLGISQCFGIKLPENFRNPFFSISFHQHWQRWHITIFTFYKDYIFYPIIRSKIIVRLKIYLNKKSKWLANHIPVFVAYIFVWVFAGLWHGGNLKAMLGNCLLPCMYLIFTDIIHDYLKIVYKKYKFVQNNLIYRIMQMIGVYMLLCLCWIFFIAHDVKEGFFIIFKIFSSFDFSFYVDSIYVKDFYIIPIGILVLFIVDILKENKIDMEKFCANKISFIPYLFILLILILLIIYFGLHIPNNFIYSSF